MKKSHIKQYVTGPIGKPAGPHFGPIFLARQETPLVSDTYKTPGDFTHA